LIESRRRDSHFDQAGSIAAVVRALGKNLFDLIWWQSEVGVQHLADGLAEIGRHRDVALLV
jgi:hypothetical protein